jgi:predicted amidohydrolase YtcJ
MVTAMAVRKGKIEYVGNKKTANQYIGKKSKVIDLKGKWPCLVLLIPTCTFFRVVFSF